MRRCAMWQVTRHAVGRSSLSPSTSLVYFRFCRLSTRWASHAQDASLSRPSIPASASYRGPSMPLPPNRLPGALVQMQMRCASPKHWENI